MAMSSESALKTGYLELVMRHKWLPYAAIGFLVAYFNLLPSFGYKGLWGDDQTYFFIQVASDQYGPWAEMLSLNRGFGLILYYPVIRLLSVSPHLARFVVVMLVMVPMSWLCFHLYRNVFGLPMSVALASSVLPHILPGQFEIPLFVGAGSAIFILVIGFIPLFFGIHYLKADAPDFRLYFCAIFAQVVFLAMREQSVFTAFAYIVFFLTYTRLNRRHLFLVGPFLLFSLIRSIYTLSHPAGDTTTFVGSHSLTVMGERLRFAAMVVDPIFNTFADTFPKFWSYYLVYLITIVFGFTLFLRWPTHHPKVENIHPMGTEGRRYLCAYLFGLIWVATTLIPFFFTAYFVERYAHLCSYGYSLILSLTVYSILSLGRPKKTAAVVTIVMVAMLCAVGQLRYYRLEIPFQQYNARIESVSKNLQSRYFPQDAQIVLAGDPGLWSPDGYWAWSSGLLKYLTKRHDITGLISQGEAASHDAFNGPDLYSPNKGLHIDRPTFLYRVSGANFTQMEYALQWKAPSTDSDWVIYRVNKQSGTPSTFSTGKGWDDYVATLDRLGKIGIGQTDVLWGTRGFETPKEAAAAARQEPGVHQTKRDIKANAYTDAKWHNGVLRQSDDGKGVFYIVIGKGTSIPFALNDTLVFSKSGKAKVINIDLLQNPDSKSVFIMVDMPLDPIGDGFPNPIRIEKN